MQQQNENIGLILAAGRGRRMGKDSKLPKCLNNVKGRALIEYQVSALRAINLSSVVVITGYQRHLVAPFGDLEVFNDEWQNTNMVYSLLKASSIVDKSGCIVSYGDIFYDESALQALLDCQNDISILYSDNWTELWRMRSDDPLADAETFQLNSDQTVKLIGTRPESLEEIEGQYMGVLRFTHLGWKIFTNFTATLPPSTLREISMTSVLNSMISQGLLQIGAVKYSGVWGEVDTESDLKLYNSM
jgi:L-glutamine-phosphate cytidylyltransferase